MRKKSFMTSILFFVLLFLNTLLASAGTSCEEGKIPWSELDYVGIKLYTLGGKCTKIDNVYNDNQARDACLKKGIGQYFVNPGNPQYIENHPPYMSHGSRKANDLGYYFCLRGANFDKKYLCEKLGKERPDLTIKFNQIGNEKDGDCFCGEKGSTKLRDCSQSIPTVASEENKKKCESLNGKVQAFEEELAGHCKCSASDKFIDPSKNETCEVAKTIVEEKPEPGTVSPEITNCVKEYENIFGECKALGEKAKITCDQNNASNKKLDGAKSFIKTISDGLIQKAAGSGAQSQCAGASLLASGSYTLLNELKAMCDNELKDCTNKCNEIQKNVNDYCIGKSRQSAGDESGGSADQAFLSQENARLTPLVAEGKKSCLIKAVENQDLMKQGLKAFDSAARSASMCACQLSVRSAVNCNDAPGPQDCEFKPAQPLCSGAGLLNCQLGSLDFDKDKCQCLREPNLGKCKAPPGKVPFAFAEDARIIAGGGGLGSPVGGSGGGNSDMDLGGYGQKDAVTDDNGPAQGNAPGFAGSGGGGSSGGSGGGGGGGNGDGAAAGTDGEPAEKNLGIMGLVKSAIGGIFGKGGGGGNAAKDPYSAGKPQRPDVNAWKPRGAASIGCKASQVRCKNETIWDIHHEWYVEGQPTLLNGGPN